jgi:hypothetical protein
MLVRFCTTSRSVNERDGKKTSSVSLEIQKILNVEADPEEKEEPGDLLDKYMEEETSKS